MNNPLPDQPEQPQEAKTSKPETIEKIKSFFVQPNYLFQNCFYIAALALSITALSSSIRSFKNANEQFKINSERSDSLFKIQYDNEQRIITNLERMQEQSESQFKSQSELTNTQIDITERLLNDQINSGSPKIIIIGNRVDDKNVVVSGKYSPVITTFYKNSGKRDAFNVVFRAFIVLNDFELSSTGTGFPITKVNVGPEQEDIFSYKPRFDDPITTFYYCYEISYFDKTINRNHYRTSFLKFFNDRGEDSFLICSDQDEEKIKKSINEFLLKNHLVILHE